MARFGRTGLLALLYTGYFHLNPLWADPNADLQHAIAREDIAAMEKAIAAGADVFAPYYNYRKEILPDESTFSKAAVKGNLNAMMLLLKRVHKPTKEQKALLSHALSRISTRLYQRLPDFKADEEAKQAEKLAMAEGLVGAGADVNFRNGAPIVWHVGNRNVKTVKFLLAKKAKVTDAAVFSAATFSNGEIMELLLRAGGNPNAIDANGSSAVLSAVQYKTDALEMLIKYKADVNRPYKNGLTPLNKAIYYKHSKAEEILRAAGAKDAPLPENFTKNMSAAKAAAKPAALTKEQLHAENYKKNKRELDRLKATMDYLAPKIHAIENEMSALGAQVGNTGYSSPTVTGIDCDGQNQNCRNKYQGGGETGSSYIGRKDREERIRKLWSERFDLVRQYDRLAEEYNKILEGK